MVPSEGLWSCEAVAVVEMAAADALHFAGVQRMSLCATKLYVVQAVVWYVN